MEMKLTKGWSIKALKLALVLFFATGLVAACSKTSSEEYLKKAQLDFDKNEFITAVIYLKNSLQQDSSNSRARYLLGKTYIKIGDGASAEKEIKAAQRLGFPSDLLVIPLGRAYLLQGKSKELLQDLNLEPDSSNQIRAELFVLKAQAHLMLDEKNKAINLLNKAHQEDPDSLSVLLAKARLAIIQGDLALSQRLVEQVIDKQQNNIEAWLILGEGARLNGDYVAAINSYNKALELEPANVRALIGKAGTSIATGDLQSALQSAKKIQIRSPEHPLANYVRAVVLYKQNNIEGAEQALQKVVRVAPKHFPSHLMLGAIYFSNARYEQARVSLGKVLNASSQNLAARKLLASTWLKLGRPESAIEVLEEILPSNGNDAQLLALLGGAYMQTKAVSKGAEYLERAVNLSPGNAAIQTQLALGHLTEGKTSEAIKVLETAVELGQDLFQADAMLVLTHLRNKQFTKALNRATQLVKKLPTNPLPYSLLGAAYIGLNDMDAARKSYEKALEIKPDFTLAEMNLARLAEQGGDRKGAIAHLRNILKLKEGDIDALLALIRLAQQDGKQAEAIVLLDRAWEKNVGDMRVGILQVRRWIAQKQPTKALNIAKELEAKYPQNFTVQKMYGTVLLANDKHDDALMIFQELVKNTPRAPEAYYLLGKAYLHGKDRISAKGELLKALKLQVDYLPAQVALAGLELRAGETKKALTITRQIKKQRPASTAGYQMEGDVYMQTTDYAAAARAYQKGYKQAASGILAIKIYQAHKKLGANNNDLVSLKNWLSANPNDVVVRFVLASAYQSVKNNPESIKQYRRILETQPKNIAALNNVAWLYHLEGNADAVAYARKAFESAPGNPAVSDTLGWLLLENGKVKESLEYLKKAIQKAPQVPEIRYHFALALSRDNQVAQARKELERLLETSGNFSEAKVAKALLMSLEGR